MDAELGRRAPDLDERIEIARDLRELVWKWTRRMADLGPDEGPRRWSDPDGTDDQEVDLRLATLAVQSHLAKELEAWTTESAVVAVGHGAGLADVADALGVTRQAVEKRWGYLRRGHRVVVVISRRDKVHADPDDPRGAYGEVGGGAQYDADRGAWGVGRTVRATATHAIVAVDGTVKRVYRLDPDGWYESETVPGKWEFTAVGDAPLDPEAVAAAVAAGELPYGIGADCPTRVGGAYRPEWF
jgi:hypothetical protein